MKIYLAGPITGLEKTEYTARFNAAAEHVRSLGWTVLSPVELFPENPVWEWCDYMLADLRIIWTHANAILMLDGWTDSDGAKLEHHAAKIRGIDIYYEPGEVPVLA